MKETLTKFYQPERDTKMTHQKQTNPKIDLQKGKHTLQHAATTCITRSVGLEKTCRLFAAAHCFILQHTATTDIGKLVGLEKTFLQHAATYCNTLQQRTAEDLLASRRLSCDMLHHTATHCNTVQQLTLEDLLALRRPPFSRFWSANINSNPYTCYCSVLQCVAVCCSVLQCVAVCCLLQCVAYTSSQT